MNSANDPDPEAVRNYASFSVAIADIKRELYPEVELSKVLARAQAVTLLRRVQPAIVTVALLLLACLASISLDRALFKLLPIYDRYVLGIPLPAFVAMLTALVVACLAIVLALGFFIGAYSFDYVSLIKIYAWDKERQSIFKNAATGASADFTIAASRQIAKLEQERGLRENDATYVEQSSVYNSIRQRLRQAAERAESSANMALIIAVLVSVFGLVIALSAEAAEITRSLAFQRENGDTPPIDPTALVVVRGTILFVSQSLTGLLFYAHRRYRSEMMFYVNELSTIDGRMIGAAKLDETLFQLNELQRYELLRLIGSSFLRFERNFVLKKGESSIYDRSFDHDNRTLKTIQGIRLRKSQ